jgi:hypothetical protein
MPRYMEENHGPGKAAEGPDRGQAEWARPSAKGSGPVDALPTLLPFAMAIRLLRPFAVAEEREGSVGRLALGT